MPGDAVHLGDGGEEHQGRHEEGAWKRRGDRHGHGSTSQELLSIRRALEENEEDGQEEDRRDRARASRDNMCVCVGTSTRELPPYIGHGKRFKCMATTTATFLRFSTWSTGTRLGRHY